jgi:hypothetical protein
MPSARRSRLAVLVGLIVAGLLTGCGNGEVIWTMMPPPVIMTDLRLDLARRVAPADRDTDVRVL